MNQTSPEALLERAQELITIESTADNPAGLRAAYEYLREYVRRAGKDITIEEFERGGKPSFLAYRGQTRPDNFRIILNAHVDVVPGKPEQFQPVVKDSKLYGRGAYDMKAAAVVLAQVFCEYVGKVPYALGLQVVTDEELAGQNGTLYQIEQGVRGDFVICGESGRSTAVYEIANQAKGIVSADVGFHGTAAHGAYPWKGDNAAAKAARFLHAMHDRYPIPTEATYDTTMTVTSIVTNNATARNLISDYAYANINARYTADDPHFRSKEAFIAHIKQIDPEAEVVQFHDFSAPLYTSPDNKLLQGLKASAERTEGAAFSFVTRHATSDGRMYGQVGNEACEFGIAGEHQHGDDEYIPLQAFENYLNTMRDFLTKTAATEQLGRTYNG